ncbi:MAG: type II toxin-antitoxin system RelE/ParE family toxin [Candidatus Binataceae bacterium]
MNVNDPAIEVIVTEEFEAWYMELDDQDTAAVTRVVGLLEEKGITLGFPYSSDIKESAIALRELRIQSRGDPLRVFYRFDPRRHAVLLIGGDKTGDPRFYEQMISLAERIWRDYLNSIRKEAQKR